MKCEECGYQFSICEYCNMSVFLGSSAAEHYLKCSLGNPVFAAPDGGYLPWEAPAPHCPNCWHKENGNCEPVLANSELGQKIKSHFGAE